MNSTKDDRCVYLSSKVSPVHCIECDMLFSTDYWQLHVTSKIASEGKLFFFWSPSHPNWIKKFLYNRLLQWNTNASYYKSMMLTELRCSSCHFNFFLRFKWIPISIQFNKLYDLPNVKKQKEKKKIWYLQNIQQHRPCVLSGSGADQRKTWPTPFSMHLAEGNSGHCIGIVWRLPAK